MDYSLGGAGSCAATSAVARLRHFHRAGALFAVINQGFRRIGRSYSDGGNRYEVCPLTIGRRQVDTTERIGIALIIGVASGFVTTLLYQLAPGGDFFQVWAAARVVRDGGNPYAQVGPGLAYNWGWPLYYPAPAFLLAVPVSWLTSGLAGAIFFGISNGALAYALLRTDGSRLLIPVSGAWLEAALYCQWSPILTAAFLLPGLGWVFAAKPNLGLALFLARPSRAALIGCSALILVSLITLPTWPTDWLATVRGASHVRMPIATWPGVLLVLALLKWRRWDARLLLALSCVPQTPHLADTLPLFLIPAGWMEMAVLVVTSHIEAWWMHYVASPTSYEQAFAMSAPLITALIYLPCLIMVLRRPNQGNVPRWIERGVARLRSRFAMVQPAEH
jgi:hypothetical protein